MSNYTKHIVAKMDESNVQNCLVCGEKITDYRNVSFMDNSKPKGFPPGEVYAINGNLDSLTVMPRIGATINHCK